MQRFDWLKLRSLRKFYENCRLTARSLHIWNDYVPIYCFVVYCAIRMWGKKVTRVLRLCLEFHSMAVVTYAVKVICIRESKKRLESMLKLFSFLAACFSVSWARRSCSVGSVCLTSWKIVFQGRKWTARELLHCEHLHLGDMGKQCIRKNSWPFFLLPVYALTALYEKSVQDSS